MIALDKAIIQIYRAMSRANSEIKEVKNVNVRDIINFIKSISDEEAVFYCSLILRYHPYMWKACENTVDKSMDNRYRLKWCFKNKTYSKLITVINENIDTFNKLVFKPSSNPLN